jgi:hypothetical protein
MNCKTGTIFCYAALAAAVGVSTMVNESDFACSTVR